MQRLRQYWHEGQEYTTTKSANNRGYWWKKQQGVTTCVQCQKWLSSIKNFPHMYRHFMTWICWKERDLSSQWIKYCGVCEMSKDMNNYVRVSCNNTVGSAPEFLKMLMWSILERKKKEDIGRGKTSYGRRTDGRVVDSPLTRGQSIAEWFSLKLKECPDYVFFEQNENFKRSWTK